MGGPDEIMQDLQPLQILWRPDSQPAHRTLSWDGIVIKLCTLLAILMAKEDQFDLLPGLYSPVLVRLSPWISFRFLP